MALLGKSTALSATPAVLRWSTGSGLAPCSRLHPGALVEARDVLAEYGNMSAASVLFVLDRILNRDEGWNCALMTALGPGFSAGFVVLRR